MAMRQLTKDMSSVPVMFGGEKVLSRVRGSEALPDVPPVFSERLRNLEREAICPRSHTAAHLAISLSSYLLLYTRLLQKPLNIYKIREKSIMNLHVPIARCQH